MNSAHLHLLLNHIPVIVAPLGLAILALGLWRRRRETMVVGLGVIVFAAISTVPAYLTGQPAALIVSELTDTPDELIERHEDVASQAFAAVGLAGCAALASLILVWRRGRAPGWLVVGTLILALIASVTLGIAANLGGQIRHTEIRDQPRPGVSPGDA